jgi:hypothetical protein
MGMEEPDVEQGFIFRRSMRRKGEDFLHVLQGGLKIPLAEEFLAAFEIVTGLPSDFDVLEGRTAGET